MRPYIPVKNQLRRRLEAFSSRIPYLPRHEIQLLRIFLSGCTFSQIAAMAKVSPATVSRRIAKIVSRLSAANYMYALRRNEAFSSEQMAMLRAYFVEGSSISQISRESGKSRACISRTIAKLQTVIKDDAEN